VQSRRSFAAMIGIFAAVLFLALAILAAGLLGLLANVDVLTERDTGPLIAPVMFTVATAFLFTMITRIGARKPAARPPVVSTSLLLGILTYFLYLFSGGTLYSLGKGRPLLGILFFGSNAGGGVAISIGVIAIVVTFASLLLFSIRDSGGATTPPRWPWEGRDGRDRRE
jgi:hypothetical protein